MEIKNLLTGILSPPQATGYYGRPPSPHGGPKILYNKRGPRGGEFDPTKIKRGTI
jgi:hypothetical protein